MCFSFTNQQDKTQRHLFNVGLFFRISGNQMQHNDFSLRVVKEKNAKIFQDKFSIYMMTFLCALCVINLRAFARLYRVC